MNSPASLSGFPATPATRREWLGLGVIALPCMIYSMDLTVLNLAVPTLTRELQPSAGQLLWLIDIYGFMVAGFLMTMGTLGDRIGRRRLLMIGAAAVGLASIVAAFSTSAETLIVMRALLGVAGATLAPFTLSLITVMFTDEKERTFAISMWIASFSAGGGIGPVVGGVLIEFFFWGSVFLVAVPPMILLLIVGPRLLPEYKAPEAGRLDLISAGLSLTAVLSVIYGVKQMAEFGVSWRGLGTIAAGAALGFVSLALSRELVPIVASSVVFSIGFTPVIALTTGLIVGSAPPERTGAASAMSETSAELGWALGIALLGSLGAAIYRTQMAGLTPDGVAGETLDAARATLGGAVAAAELHPSPHMAGFLAAARDAFMSGLHAVALLSIGGMLLCAALAFRYLRKARPASH